MSSDGTIWLEQLPTLIAEVSRRWDLDVGKPYPLSNVSFVAPAAQRGRDVVLKVQWPHSESEHESEALHVWDGDGAVELLDHDERCHALLLERCVPGTHLAVAGADESLRVLIGLLPRLWKRVEAPFRSVSDEAAGWADSLVPAWEKAGRRCDRRLVDAASEHLRHLPSTQGDQVLVHQDLHAVNVLAAQREPWLVIDPKPLIGEREFALAPIIRSFELGHSRDDVVGRLNRLTAELGLDRERATAWTVVQTMAWSFGSKYSDLHHETVGWLLEA